MIAGIGCRRGCPAEDIVAAVRRAEAQGGVVAAALAAPGFKRHEAGLHGAAAALGLALRFVGAAAMARVQPACPTRSGVALAAVGLASVAEAAALAAASRRGGLARLVVPRVVVGGATCALAS